MRIICTSGRPAHATQHRRGSMLVYAITATTVFVAICSLAVDYGRVQVARTELQRAADAAARAGAMGLLTGKESASAQAKQYALANMSDGGSVALTDADIEYGKWRKNAFYNDNNGGRDAIRITLRRTAQRGNPIPLAFASLIGKSSQDLTATATAYSVNRVNVNQPVPSTHNPYLAGVPDGTYANVGNPHNNPDRAPINAPTTVNLPLEDGAALAFDAITGSAGYDPKSSSYTPDGNINMIMGNDYGANGGAELGKSNLKAPMNALVGVFLDDSNPVGQSPPETLDFSTATSRDFKSLPPQLRQVFFIGDGRDSLGNVQEFIVPAGATRFYLATWDQYEWNNNYGNRTVQVYRPKRVALVK